MLHPMIIQSIAADQLEESRRRADLGRRIRQARAASRPAKQPRKARRHLRLVTLPVAGPATRLPR
jgi:hypothetical protein